MKNLKIFIYINLGISALFSLLCFPFGLDVSLVAWPMALLFSAGMGHFFIKNLLKDNSIAKIKSIRLFLQYEPFVFLTAFVLQRAGKRGTPFALDLIQVLLWVAALVVSIILQYKLSEKRFLKLNPVWEKERKLNGNEKPKGGKRVLYEIFEWLDALLQAVYALVLINIFLFQLYEIPSESMVPTFLVKDRVVVFKTFAGPKFPLSDIGLPYLTKYDRGDIVVFRNPHYSDDRQSEVKNFFSQFVFMVTLTTVNINRDENGDPKADPLVKRVTAVPGEQIMLMDGKLYARTKDSPQFHLVDMDSKYAAWDLNKYTDYINNNQIRVVPMSTDEVQITQEVEENRRNLDLVKASAECRQIASQFNQYAKGGVSSNWKNLFGQNDLYVMNFYSTYKMNCLGLAKTLQTSPGASMWFNHFMCDWTNEADDLSKYREDGSLTGDGLIGGNLYTDSNFRLNVMTKLALGRTVIKCLQLSARGVADQDICYNSEFLSTYEDLSKLVDYVIHLDQRNMPVFPANAEDGSPSYIPENCYFMMGDNRYNSLDMRHSYDAVLTALDSNDEYSMTYESNMAPQYVSRDRMLGKARFRFWPTSRIGFLEKAK